MLSSDVRRIVAVALVFSTALITMPVSAADFTTARPVIGSVSAVGPVELRGVGISQEGTLFAGDRIRAGQKGYAKVLLGTGSKIELSERTDVNVSRDAEGVKIAMNTGTVGFTAGSPLRIDVMPFEVIATDGSSGHVAVMNSGAAGVRALNGKVTVRNLKTAQSFVLNAGQERLLATTTGVHAPSLAELASNVPGPVPAPVPQAPAGRTTGGLAMDTGAWLAVIGGAALAGVAVWGLVVALDNRDEIKNLRGQLATNNANTQQLLTAVANAAAIANAAALSQAQAASIAALAGQAQLALTLAGDTDRTEAANLVAEATSIQAQLSALQPQIQAAQQRLAAGGTAPELATLLGHEERLRNAGNALATRLNNLLNANRTVPGIPQTTVAPIGPPVVASASVPV